MRRHARRLLPEIASVEPADVEAGDLVVAGHTLEAGGCVDKCVSVTPDEVDFTELRQEVLSLRFNLESGASLGSADGQLTSDLPVLVDCRNMDEKTMSKVASG